VYFQKRRKCGEAFRNIRFFFKDEKHKKMLKVREKTNGHNTTVAHSS
jgi:hypothetical protein